MNKHAWYSPEMAKLYDTITYRSADDPSKLVEVTLVCESKEHNCGWEDMQYLGMVDEYVRSNRVSEQTIERSNFVTSPIPPKPKPKSEGDELMEFFKGN